MATETLIWLIPLPPALAFFLIVLFTNRSNRLSWMIGVGAAFLSWLGGMFVFIGLILVLVQGGLVRRLAGPVGEQRLAIVGETKWEKGMAVFCRPFTTAKIKYFDQSDIDKARAWIQE